MKPSTLTKLRMATSLLREVMGEIELEELPDQEEIDDYKPGG